MRLRTALLLIACGFFISYPAAGEDALNALQNDVLMAKQKHNGYVSKIASVNSLLDEKAREAESRALDHADNVIRQKEAPALKSSPEFRETFPDPAERRILNPPAADGESPLSALDPTPDRKGWRWPKFDFFQPKSRKMRDPNGPPGGTPISEAEALYKVAISDKKITVEEAVEIGVANNLKIQAAKKNIEVSDAKLTEAKRALYPSVQAVAEFNGGKVPGAEGLRFYKGRSRKLNVTQPLYYGGELTNTVKQAEENIRVAKAEYKKAADDLVHQIRVAYYGVVKAEYNAEYQITLYEKVNEVFQKIKKQREALVIAEIDLLNVESQYYQTLYQVESAKNDILSANVSLRQAMNIPTEERIPVDLKLDFEKVRPEMQEIMDRAMQNNPDVRAKAFIVEAARFGMEIQESKKRPHVELRGSYGMLGEAFADDQAMEEGKASIDTEKEWFLGVHGVMPLGASSVEYEQIKHKYGPTVLALTGSEDWKHRVAFNLFDRMGAVTDEKLAQYTLLQAESEYQAVKDEVSLRLRDEFYSLQRYLIQIDSSTARVKYQEKQNAILEYLLSLQETSPSTYIESLVEQTQDRYAFIQAVADYQVTLSTIGLLIGDPYYFDNQRQLKNREKTDDASQSSQL